MITIYERPTDGDTMAKYNIIENDYSFETIEAESAAEALELVDPPEASDYSPGPTFWIQWTAVNVDDDDDHDSKTFTVQPTEPECEAGHEHEWSDHDPVQGNGGGVRYSERCEHCGVVRRTDTWAQNPTNGTQGHTAIEYVEPERPTEFHDD